MISVTVQYFAILREQRGRSAETLVTAAATPEALYAELRARHGLTDLEDIFVRLVEGAGGESK